MSIRPGGTETGTPQHFHCHNVNSDRLLNASLPVATPCWRQPLLQQTHVIPSTTVRDFISQPEIHTNTTEPLCKNRNHSKTHHRKHNGSQTRLRTMFGFSPILNRTQQTQLTSKPSLFSTTPAAARPLVLDDLFALCRSFPPPFALARSSPLPTTSLPPLWSYDDSTVALTCSPRGFCRRLCRSPRTHRHLYQCLQAKVQMS